MGEKWHLFSMTFRWPHEGMLVGFELFNPTEEEPYCTIKLHFLLVSLTYEFGHGQHPYM